MAASTYLRQLASRTGEFFAGNSRTALERRELRVQRSAQRRAVARRAPVCLEPVEDRLCFSVLFTPQNGTEHATTGGGSIMANAAWGTPIYSVYWGSYWATSAGQQYAAQIQGSINAMFYNSPYLDTLKQYGTSYRAGVSGSGTVQVFNYSDPANGFSQGNLSSVVNNAIDNQGFPKPHDFSNEGIYVVFTPPGISTSGDSGYHTYYTHYNFPFDFQTVHDAWVGTNGGIDGTTNTLSHEIAETISDPNGDAWQVDPRSGSSWNEIGDNEAQNYSYRLNGYQMQSLWSQNDGAFKVNDGNSQNFWVNNGVLNLYGDQFASAYNDSISINKTSSGGLTATMNGQTVTFDPGAISSVQVYGFGGSNSISVLQNSVPVTVNGGSGNNAVTVGSGNLDNNTGAVTVNGNSSFTDTVNVNDSTAGFSDTYTVTNNAVSRVVFGGLTYSGLHGLTLNAETGGNTINVNSTSTATTINAGDGNDTVNVGSGNLDPLSGAVVVNGGNGTDQVNVQDHTAGFSDSYTITSTTLNRIIFGGLTYGGIEGLTLNAETGSNIISVNSTTSVTPVTINAGAGNDVINVGNGNLDLLGGAVVVNGGIGSDSVNVQDNTAGFSDTYTVTGSTVSRIIFGGLTYGGVEALTLNAETGSNTINVSSTSIPTTVNGGDGNDTIIVSSVASGIANAFFGGNGNDTINASAATSKVSLDGGAGNDVLIGGHAGDVLTGGDGDDSLTGNGGNDSMAGGLGNDSYIFVAAASAETDIVTELAGQGSDSLDFRALTSGIGVTVNLTSDSALATHTNRTVKTGAAGEAANFENAIGGAGNDHLTGNNAANTLIGNAGNNVVSGGASNDVLISSSGNDSLIGGTGDDTYKFFLTGTTVTDVITELAGGGSDTLDFSALGSGTPVTVNLTSDSALATHSHRTVKTAAAGQAFNIENVIGGAGNDTITANTAANKLSGGAGNDVFKNIFDGKKDSIDGGAGTDSIVGPIDAFDVLTSVP